MMEDAAAAVAVREQRPRDCPRQRKMLCSRSFLMANERVLKWILWAKSKPAMTWAEPPKMLRSKSADKSCIETVRK